ncbi:MAG: hypothetical protein KC643_26660 [Nitrospira sp.]|nr:hypothetical protein [Nitrospira sp.]MDR4487318.1 hypothetical protein [Nitrospirales bacterium]
MAQTILERIKSDENKLRNWEDSQTLVVWSLMYVILIWFVPWAKINEVLFFGVSTALLAGAWGFYFGLKRRRFPPLNVHEAFSGHTKIEKGTTVFIQNNLARPETRLTIEDATKMLLAALEARHIDWKKAITNLVKLEDFGLDLNGNPRHDPKAEEVDYPGLWVWVSCDSRGEPIYQNYGEILRSLAKLKHEIHEPQYQERISLALSQIHKIVNSAWKEPEKILAIILAEEKKHKDEDIDSRS